MLKQIIFANQKIIYKLKTSYRARRLRLSVALDSSVTLTVPHGMSGVVAERFLHKKVFWILKTLARLKNHNQRLVPKFSKLEYMKYKQPALKLAWAKVSELNQHYNFQFNKISIRNQKTRWGSCSRKGNLNFNYKIVFLPEAQLNYLVVHELCHLKEFNHSKAFWSLVAETIPNYRQLKILLHTQ